MLKSIREHAVEIYNNKQSHTTLVEMVVRLRRITSCSLSDAKKEIMRLQLLYQIKDAESIEEIKELLIQEWCK